MKDCLQNNALYSHEEILTTNYDKNGTYVKIGLLFIGKNACTYVISIEIVSQSMIFTRYCYADDMFDLTTVSKILEISFETLGVKEIVDLKNNMIKDGIFDIVFNRIFKRWGI